MSSADITADITAAPEAPAALIAPMFPALMPPMAMAGSFVARQIAARPAGPIGGAASDFVAVASKTGPAPM
jgi:hypothetical protein